jgi:hypothetical protein
MKVQEMGNLSALIAAAGLSTKKEAIAEEVTGKRMAHLLVICLRNVVVVTSLEMARDSNSMRTII